MITYIIRRIIILIPLMFAISLVTFIVINLPPGDYMTRYIANLQRSGIRVTEEDAANIRHKYGMDKSPVEQYFVWMKNLLQGDFGRSFSYNDPVLDLVLDRVGYSMVITLLTSIFVFIVTLVIGIYSALHQYTFFDYFWSFVGFIGMATPSFLLALVVGYLVYRYLNYNVFGLFSIEYVMAPWSLAKVIDMLKHMIVPVLIIGTSSTAGGIQITRGMLLDELNKQYVITARAKGLPEGRLLFKYPVRVILNPMMSTIGWMLPGLISGEVLVSMVLNIPTTGPIMLQALLSQDMYLAGSFLFVLSVLTLIGTLISDLALAWLDPRIRFTGVAQ